MTVSATPASRRVVFEHHPVMLWFVAAAVLCLGAGFVMLAGRELAAGGLSLPALGAAAAGFVGIGMSAFAARHAERTTLVVDADARRIALSGRLPWRTRHAEWRFDDVAKVQVETWDDSEGKVWRPLLELSSGELVPITSWQNDYARVDSLRDQANKLLSGRVIGAVADVDHFRLASFAAA